MYRDYNKELYHFGIKGMKWGVRRYQNEDGSYTEAGKQRYGSSSSSSNSSSSDSSNTKSFKEKVVSTASKIAGVSLAAINLAAAYVEYDDAYKKERAAGENLANGIKDVAANGFSTDTIGYGGAVLYDYGEAARDRNKASVNVSTAMDLLNKSFS